MRSTTRRVEGKLSGLFAVRGKEGEPGLVDLGTLSVRSVFVENYIQRADRTSRSHFWHNFSVGFWHHFCVPAGTTTSVSWHLTVMSCHVSLACVRVFARAGAMDAAAHIDPCFALTAHRYFGSSLLDLRTRGCQKPSEAVGRRMRASM